MSGESPAGASGTSPEPALRGPGAPPSERSELRGPGAPASELRGPEASPRAALRGLFASLDARQRLHWVLLVPFAAAGAASESVAALLVVALVRAADEPASAGERLASLGLSVEPATAVGLVCLGVAAFYAAKNALRFAEARAQLRCVNDTLVAVGTRLVRGYLRAPYAFHLRRNSAELIRNARHSVDQVGRMVLVSIAAAATECLVVVGVLAVVVASSPSSTLAAGIVVALLVVAILRLTQQRHRAYGTRAQAAQAALFQILQQSLGGVKEVKVLGREGFFERAFERERRDLADVDIRRGALALVPRFVVETLFVCGVAALVYGAHVRGGRDLVPLLGLAAYAGLRVLPSLHWIVNHVNNARFGAAAVRDVYRDWAPLVERAGASAGEGVSPLPFRDRVVLKDVSFTYEGAPRPALHGVDLEIRCGESIGLVGPTGAGKSTLVDLLLGLLAPTRGQIEVDGVNIRGAERRWQAGVGYVPQRVFLADDTIRRNVAWGLEDDAIDDARVARALRMAQIDDFVRGLPDGWETLVGERGVRLSGGQSQRVAVARALYREPGVLVFDEATAALDEPTERGLARAIDDLSGGLTLVIIAHRLATVRHCDRIVLLEDGRVKGVGAFDELLERSELFRALAAGAKPG